MNPLQQQAEAFNPDIQRVERDFWRFKAKWMNELFRLQDPIQLNGITLEQFQRNMFEHALRIAYFNGRTDEQKLKEELGR